MAYTLSEEIARMVSDRMASGKYASEEALLREALEALAAQEDDFEAIQQAIDEMAAGDAGVSLDDAIASIRQKHQQRTSA